MRILTTTNPRDVQETKRVDLALDGSVTTLVLEDTPEGLRISAPYGGGKIVVVPETNRVILRVEERT